MRVDELVKISSGIRASRLDENLTKRLDDEVI